jgi:hypothetical protein
MSATLIEAPASNTSHEIVTLAYLEAYDAVLNDDYAFVAYKETDVSSREWRVRIRSRHTAGAVFEPEMIRQQARAADANDRPYFTWGFSMDTSPGDPRQIQFRVHQRGGKATMVEMYVRLRRADGSPAQPITTSFPWPDA